MIGKGDCGEIGEWRLARETEVFGEKTCPSVILSTTNPTWLDPGWNPGRRGGKPATNRLSYGAAFHYILLKCYGKVLGTLCKCQNLSKSFSHKLHYCIMKLRALSQEAIYDRMPNHAFKYVKVAYFATVTHSPLTIIQNHLSEIRRKSIYVFTALCLGLGRFFSFLILYTVDRAHCLLDFPRDRYSVHWPAGCCLATDVAVICLAAVA
jgi:hypothetical protein